VPHPTQDKLDMNRLRRQDPIILLEEQVLYEDELADNGSSKLEVKIVRVIICRFSINY
jgi:type 2A phosphatase activator TIP41